MFIKLGIIAGIVILGGMIFSTEIDNIFPTTSATVIDSLKDDVTDLGVKASDSIEERIDDSFDEFIDDSSNTIDEFIDDSSNTIDEFIDDSSNTIDEFIDNSSNTIDDDSSNTIDDDSKIIYETLSLSTKQQSDDNILLQYFDSSGKTESVSVVIRTEQKELFSGIFFTSMFETIVNDASGIPYYVDMVVEHEDYGTVSSSVFNTGDASDSNINGIFFK